MESAERSFDVTAFLKAVAIALVVILVFAGLICWVVNWMTAYQYGTAVIVGGLISIVFGLFSVAGGMRSTRSYTYQSAEMAGVDTIYDRTKESQRNLFDTLEALLVLGTAGIVAVAIGLVIRVLSG
jgi:hypothetical protein